LADKQEKEEKERTKTENIKEKEQQKTEEKENTDKQEEPDKTEVKKPEEPKKEEAEESKEEKTEEKPTEKEEKPKETKKPESDKQKEKSDETKKDDKFKYIVRLSNTDVDGDKKLIYGLTSVKGIGLHIATLIADETSIDRSMKIGDLSDKQVEELQKAIDDIQNSAPEWMLNHRKDMETGEDLHLTGSEIEMRLRDEINMMKKIRSYKGIRHERGLRARGQRTRANNRRGLSLGVSKKSVQNK